jgi:hypothetical protein
MREKTMYRVVLPVLLLVVSTGCATFRSDMEGKFAGPVKKNVAAGEVDVLFILRHVRQATGFDEIPKLDAKNDIVRDFDDLFLDALTEFSNIDGYATFTEFSSDVSDPERRAKRDELIAGSDFVVRIDFLRKHSFIGHFMAAIGSAVSLTLLPMPYSRDFFMDVEVFDADGASIRKYRRTASLTRWMQTFLIFLQPFHNEAIKEERIYIEFLHDVFREMESEGVLTPGES